MRSRQAILGRRPNRQSAPNAPNAPTGRSVANVPSVPSVPSAPSGRSAPIRSERAASPVTQTRSFKHDGQTAERHGFPLYTKDRTTGGDSDGRAQARASPGAFPHTRGS